MRLALTAAVVVLGLSNLHCQGTIEGPRVGRGEDPCLEVDDDGGVDDQLSPTRLLRRTSLALRNVTPTDAEYEALLAAGDEAAQRAWIDGFVDQSLAEPAFYRTMFELGFDWFSIPLIPNTNDAPEYGARQQRVVTRCPATSNHPGALVYYRVLSSAEVAPADQCRDGPVAMIEPWWAPGTMVQFAGYAAKPPDPACKGMAGSTCGCGPNAVSCWYDPGEYAGWAAFVPWNPNGQRRQLAEEPARYFAHLAWHDLPMTDLLLSSTSVAPVDTQAAYVSQAIAGGRLEFLTDDSWWRPSKFGNARVDPEHQSDDPTAWREYSMPARNPFLLADRNYHYDPRTTTAPMLGIPAAGVLTSIGFLGTFPRERVRASRALETFACEVLSPPSSQAFNPYVTDPAREGPCQHCHKRIDPAALHFKRYGKLGDAFEGFEAKYLMPGIGEVWHWPAVWRTGAYPYGVPPFSQWNQWYRPGSAMTPVTAAEATANPEAIFLDFLPTDQTLLGEVSDGTVGPLGFAKLIVAAGAFDRCVVRHLHQQIIGRDIDPAVEAGYLDVLTKRFVDGGRKVRPFAKSLTTSDVFRRGR